MKETQSKLDTMLTLLLAGGGGGSGSGSENVSLNIIDSDITEEVASLSAGETLEVEIPFAKEGILQTLYVIVDDEKASFDVEILNNPDNGVVEYQSQNNKGFCYDVIDIIYIDDTGEGNLYLNITNQSDSSIDFELIRARGIEI